MRSRASERKTGNVRSLDTLPDSLVALNPPACSSCDLVGPGALLELRSRVDRSMVLTILFARGRAPRTWDTPNMRSRGCPLWLPCPSIVAESTCESPAPSFTVMRATSCHARATSWKPILQLISKFFSGSSRYPRIARSLITSQMSPLPSPSWMLPSLLGQVSART
eukprot:767091-Hanusia_phi.AAC.4